MTSIFEVRSGCFLLLGGGFLHVSLLFGSAAVVVVGFFSVFGDVMWVFLARIVCI